MVGLRFMPLTHIGDGFRQAVASIRSSKGEGDVTAFESLSTALAATIGTGNVAGVAGAIAVGGPMDFIRNGLGPRWAWLGTLFAIFGTLAGFGIGNGVQAHEMALALNKSLAVPPIVTGVVIAAIAFAVLIGGIERIGKVTEVVVPLMAAV